MSRGKTNQPLVIWIAPSLVGPPRPEIRTLIEQGHRVSYMYGSDTTWAESEPDLILHPAAHQWNDELWDYLDVAIKAARARRRKA